MVNFVMWQVGEKLNGLQKKRFKEFFWMFLCQLKIGKVARLNGKKRAEMSMKAIFVLELTIRILVK